MADCTKSISGMTPGEAVQCFFQADFWGSFSRIWQAFTSVTIGEWLEIGLVTTLIPALFLSYAWALLLIGCLLSWTVPKFTGWCTKWFGIYTIIAGLVSLTISTNKELGRFLFVQGWWMIFVGASMVLVTWLVEQTAGKRA